MAGQSRVWPEGDEGRVEACGVVCADTSFSTCPPHCVPPAYPAITAITPALDVTPDASSLLPNAALRVRGSHCLPCVADVHTSDRYCWESPDADRPVFTPVIHVSELLAVDSRMDTALAPGPMGRSVRESYPLNTCLHLRPWLVDCHTAAVALRVAPVRSKMPPAR